MDIIVTIQDVELRLSGYAPKIHLDGNSSNEISNLVCI